MCRRTSLGFVELVNLLLLAMNPTCENHEEEMPGLQNEAHGMLGIVAEKLHHVACAEACQGPKSADKSIYGVRPCLQFSRMILECRDGTPPPH